MSKVKRSSGDLNPTHTWYKNRPFSIRYLFLFIIAVGVISNSPNASARNYAELLTFELEHPEYIKDRLPPGLRPYYEQFQNAQLSAKPEEALIALTKLASQTESDKSLDLYVHFMAYKALLQEVTDRHGDAIQTLERVRKCKTVDDNGMTRYLADLEVARIMIENGGNPNLPDFQPSFDEKANAINRVFSLYDPYEFDTILMHVNFANLAYSESFEVPDQFGPSQLSLKRLALAQLNEVDRILDDLNSNPALSANPNILEMLGDIPHNVEFKRRDWKQRIDELQASNNLPNNDATLVAAQATSSEKIQQAAASANPLAVITDEVAIKSDNALQALPPSATRRLKYSVLVVTLLVGVVVVAILRLDLRSK